MLLIPGFPAGDGFEWDLKFKFKTEDVDTEAGFEVRYDCYTKPRRELSFTIGSVGSLAYVQLLTALQAGATFCIVPMWQLRSILPYGVSTGSDQIKLYDVTEFKAGDYAYLTRSTDISLYEVHQISSVEGLTVYLDSSVSRDYTPISTSGTWPYDTSGGYIMPCINGIIDHESLDFVGGCPGFLAKLKIDGGAWEGAVIPSSLDYTHQPMEAKYGPPKIGRDVLGTENGILQLRAFESTNRHVFELTWEFYDTAWRDLRDLFLAAKGKTNQFYLPTWMFELQVTRGSDSGATSIFLPSGYQHIYERFPRLLIKPWRTSTAPFSVFVSSYVGGDEFICSALPNETLLNDRVCFFPLVRFEGDELSFNFKDINSCQVKATFIEVLVEA